jgi:hypothetical protein
MVRGSNRRRKREEGKSGGENRKQIREREERKGGGQRIGEGRRGEDGRAEIERGEG